MTAPYYQDDHVTVYSGDCLDVMAELPDASVDAVITDPPYGLDFMGKHWDTGAVAFHIDTWAHCLRLLKPGGHLLAFGGTRTWHRLSCAIEDAGFEIRDSIAWLYGSGFPKSLDVSKAIDKAAGAEREVIGMGSPFGAGSMRNRSRVDQGYRPTEVNPEGGSATLSAPATDAAKQWQGWGTALKPSFEPRVLARKPIRGTVAGNVVEHGTGALNIDACRVAHDEPPGKPQRGMAGRAGAGYGPGGTPTYRERETDAASTAGRWPTNVVIDEHTAAAIDKDSGVLTSGANPTRRHSDKFRTAYGDFEGQEECVAHRGADSGGASRFFPTFKYQAKADTGQRPTANGVSHPTVKPLDLMRWLVRLVTPPNGVVLDPFAGSGTTAEACVHEYKRCITIEREPDYLPLIVARLSKPMEVGFDFGEPA